MSEQIKTLPKWVQDRIAKLESDVGHWKTKALEMEEGETNVFQRDYSGFPETDRRPMARDSHILFVTDDTEFDVGFRDDGGGSVLEVMTTGRKGNDRLIVRPVSANIIVIEGLSR